MVRTQIQLTERQARELKRIAAKEHVSMAEIIRRAVDAKIRAGAAEVPWEERVRRAMAAMGKFRSGLKDVSKRHDHYLAEAYDDR
ncbi:MAG: ribbon-helix-helix protein, CopG family [bacterium]